MRLLTCYAPSELQSLLRREGNAPEGIEETVSAIVKDVRENGDRAVTAYTERFDGVLLSSLEVTPEEIAEALVKTPSGFLEILREAKANIEAYHQKQKRVGFLAAERPGVMLGQKITPLDRVGIYVPGGTAAYPSTVLMDAVPAKIAGVGEIIMATPPGKNGRVPADILAAASIAGVDRVFKIGGAQAIAALAFGTESVPRVDKIVGPGNSYVAAAKRMVFGAVDIDMIAGPSEILIIADENANPRHIAMDLLSQAEHDRFSAAFLVTTSETLAYAVSAEVDTLLPTLPRGEIAEEAIRNHSAILVTDTLETAAKLANEIAPEHLELCVAEPFALLPLIRHAGSIFLGGYAPEALGDYFAGPNHTLPTSGTARFSSGLSVDDFVKKSSIIYYDRNALSAVSAKIAAFARREGLEAHARSVELRTEES